jgi:hypothetical protein
MAVGNGKTFWIAFSVAIVMCVTACSAQGPTGETLLDSQPIPDSVTSDQLKWSDLQDALRAVAPDCDLHFYDINPDQIYLWEEFTAFGVGLWPLQTPNEFSRELDLNDGPNPLGKSFVLEPSSPDGPARFAACHSTGRNWESMLGVFEQRHQLVHPNGGFWLERDPQAGYNFVYPEPERCEWGQLWGKDADTDFVASCASLMNAADSSGYWLVFRELQTPEVALTTIEERISKGPSWMDKPMGVIDRFTFSLDGEFSYFSQTGIDAVDEFWQLLLLNLPDAIDGSTLSDKFSSSFDYSTLSARSNLLRWDEVFGATSSCKGPLLASETFWYPGMCGELKVTVKQADRKTGDCLFLGTWIDKDGLEAPGLFEYCDNFTPGSVETGSTYTLIVRVEWKDSFLSSSGSKIDALRFTALAG